MEKDIKTIKNVLLFFVGILIVYLLKVLSSLFIPLALALFIAITMYPILEWLQSKKVPYSLSILLIMVVSGFILNTIGELIYDTSVSLIGEKDVLFAQIQVKLEPLLVFIKSVSGFDLNNYSGGFFNAIKSFISFDKIISSSGTFANFITSLAGTIFMTILYLFAILGGILSYENYLDFIEKNDNSDEKGKLTLAFEEIKNSITTYMKVKFLISLGTGVCFWLISFFFGIKFALFWGFFAFLLNFVPTFGSIIASLPPMVLGLIQIDSIFMFVIFISLLGVVQLVFGNIVDPMLMGSSLSLNTVFVLLGLLLGTYIWGIVGTILSVPLLVLAKVALNQIPDAQVLVRIMSSTNSDEDSE